MIFLAVFLVMKELLLKFEELLTKLNPSLIANMNPGLSIKSIQEKIELTDLQLPDEIIELYKWKNGAIDVANQITGPRQLFRRAILMNIDKAIWEHNNFTKQEFGFYLNAYFPLFESLGEEFFVVDCDPGSKTFNMILSYEIKGVYLTGGAVPVFDNPVKMIETIIRCYEKNVYKFDSSANRFNSNMSMERGIIIEMNPNANKIRRSSLGS